MVAINQRIRNFMPSNGRRCGLRPPGRRAARRIGRRSWRRRSVSGSWLRKSKLWPPLGKPKGLRVRSLLRGPLSLTRIQRRTSGLSSRSHRPGRPVRLMPRRLTVGSRLA